MNTRTRLLTALLCLASASAASAQEIAERLAGFAPFLGTWRPTAEFMEARPQLAHVDAEVYQRGPHGNTIRVLEFADRTDPGNHAFEGFAYWHPQADEVRFAGYNAQNLYYFEGRYVIGPGRLTRETTVYYPAGQEFSAFPELTEPVRVFRSVRTLTAPDTMELVVHMKVDGEWRLWPRDDVAPTVLVRVESRESGVVAADPEQLDRGGSHHPPSIVGQDLPFNRRPCTTRTSSDTPSMTWSTAGWIRRTRRSRSG